MLSKIKNNKGFTIVEVMIVLAIGAMIMLIVFLAVPALQRNSRNTQRNQDAAMIAAGVNECLNNRNGQATSCNEWTATELQDFINIDKLRQLTTISGDVAIPTNNTSANVIWNRVCDAAGSVPVTAGANARSAVLVFNNENPSNGLVTRCMEI